MRVRASKDNRKMRTRFEGTNSTREITNLWIARDNDEKSFPTRDIRISAVTSFAGGKSLPTCCPQCASLTFISVKEHCTPVERALLLKERPGRYGFFHSRTIVFNYAPFAAISFFSLGFSALYTERGQNFNFLLCLPIFPEIEIMLASSPPVLVSAARSICYSWKPAWLKGLHIWSSRGPLY